MKCTCFARDWRDEDIDHYEFTPDGTFWCIYRRCPVDGNQAASVVWSPMFLGRDNEPLQADEAVAVELETVE